MVRWKGADVPCYKCGRTVKDSRLYLHQIHPECNALQWTNKLSADRFKRTTPYNETLERTDVAIYRPTNWGEWYYLFAGTQYIFVVTFGVEVTVSL